MGDIDNPGVFRKIEWIAGVSLQPFPGFKPYVLNCFLCSQGVDHKHGELSPEVYIENRQIYLMEAQRL